MITRCRVLENRPATFLDRIENRSGEIPNVSEIESITVASYDMDTNIVAKSETYTDSIADYVNSVLATDNGWNRDKKGWNAKTICDGDYWPEGGGTYRLQIDWNFIDGYVVTALYECQCVELYGE